MAQRVRSTDRPHARAGRASRGWDVRAAACLAIGLLALALALVLTLSHRDQRRAATNAVRAQANVGDDLQGRQVCQAGQLVPAGAAAIHLTAIAYRTPGPEATIVLRRRGQVIDRTTALTKAGTPDITAPIGPTTRELDDVEVCVTFGTGVPVVAIAGKRVPRMPGMRVDGTPVPAASLPVAYLRSGSESWWSYAPRAAELMGRGRGDWGGRWVVWTTAGLLLAALALVVRTLARVLVAGRAWRVRALAGTIAAVAVLNAAAWSLITPAIEVPDEQTHFAYAQLIGERGRLPGPRREETLSPELRTVLADLSFGSEMPTRWSLSQQRRLERDLHAGLPRSVGDQVGPAAFEPPFYYALEAIPYRLASGATLLDRLALMRLLSALMAGATALFAFLFVRECLPGRPWTWTVGALGVALTPTLGFVSGGVNPDALLFPLSAALLYALAAAFRHGLTTRRAVAIGALLALGIVTKINFYGLVPGALLGVALAARASSDGWNRDVARLVAIVVGAALGPYLLLTALDALVWERTFVLARTHGDGIPQHGSLTSQLSYLWQVFLPRLPGQHVGIPEFSPLYELWIKGFVGKFAWLKVHYAGWAYRLATVLLGAVCLLALRALVRDRAALRARLPELTSYAAMAAGLLLLIGLVALRGWAPGIEGAVQGRYLLPLLALFGAVLGLAARGAGARWGRAVGVSLVLACVAWSLFGQLATIAYFYG
jgi:hypothetical protein